MVPHAPAHFIEEVSSFNLTIKTYYISFIKSGTRPKKLIMRRASKESEIASYNAEAKKNDQATRAEAI